MILQMVTAAYEDEDIFLVMEYEEEERDVLESAFGRLLLERREDMRATADYQHCGCG